MSSHAYEAARDDVARDVAAVYSNRLLPEQFTPYHFVARTVCSVLVNHANLLFDEGRLSSKYVDPDYTPSTTLGNHIQDIALNLEHRPLDRGVSGQSCSHFCSMAEPQLLSSVTEIESNPFPEARPAVLVADGDGRPTGFFKQRGENTMYSLVDSSLFMLGAAALYEVEFDRFSLKKTKHKGVQVLLQNSIENVIPGRVSVLAGDEKDLRGYNPATIYGKGADKRDKKIWKILRKPSKQLQSTAHHDIVRRIESLAENL